MEAQIIRTWHQLNIIYLVLTHPLRLQLAALPLLDPARAEVERVSLIHHKSSLLANYFSQMALQRHFKTKRDYVLKRLAKLGLKVDIPPTSTFYIWLNLENLPAPLNNGLVRLDSLANPPSCTWHAFFRLSSRSCWRRRRSLSLVSSLTSTQVTGGTCLALLAITSSESLSVLPWQTSRKASIVWFLSWLFFVLIINFVRSWRYVSRLKEGQEGGYADFRTQLQEEHRRVAHRHRSHLSGENIRSNEACSGFANVVQIIDSVCGLCFLKFHTMNMGLGAVAEQGIICVCNLWG